MSIHLALAAVLTSALSGLVGAWGSPRRSGGQVLSTVLMGVSAVLGLSAVVKVLMATEVARLSWSWFLPWGRFAVELDPLGAFFLAPVFLIPALGSIYGVSYWSQRRHPRNGARVRVCYGLVTASMGMVVLARDAVLFLIVWEIMAILAFFLITAEDDDPQACAAGWIYLIAAHAGTFCLIAMFVLLRRATGSFDIAPAVLDSRMATAIFLLGVVGFGLKAGLMPLHVWLPGAHANAPSHVSAILSGVMLKMGVYGIVRLVTLLPVPRPWWGILLLTLGAISGVVGIAFAIGQRDLKRALAYSSVENVGIITMALGLALLGRASGRVDVVLLGLGGALLHVWNHALFKSLLFFNAGAVIHATHTREVNQLGGLAQRMPQTAVLFLFGGLATCGLPPLNGFVSELLIYLGAARISGVGVGVGTAVWPGASIVIPVLAMIGALSVACCVGLFGGVFLGQARRGYDRVHEATGLMRLPMLLLVLGCIAVGLAPGVFLPFVSGVASLWSPAPLPCTLPELVPTRWVSMASGTCLAFIAVGGLLARWFASRRPLAPLIHNLREHSTTCRCHSSDRELTGLVMAGTWDCGYACPTARMQYSSASFGALIIDLFGWFVRPKRVWPRFGGPFPEKASCTTEVPDVVLDRGVLPTFRLIGRLLPWVRILQQGHIQTYVFYLLLIVVALYLWGACVG